MARSPIAEALDKGVVVAYHIWLEDLQLKQYLISNYPNVTAISHPFFAARGIGMDLSSIAATYEKGQETSRRRFGVPPFWEPLFWVRTVLADLWFLGKGKKRTGVFFGVDNLNTFAGLILRALGRVDRVIYYSLDYRPKLSASPVANFIYRHLDRFCCRQADLIWVLDQGLMEERFRRGLDSKKTAPYQVVPWGTNYNSIKRRSIGEINRLGLVYMGGLSNDKGVEAAIRAMPLITERVPGAVLTILGTGRLEQDLKDLAKGLGAGDSIIFRGHIASHSEMEEIMAGGAIGIAPYRPDPDNYTNFTDPAKPKNYMACGLPVLITDVPKLARRIADNRAGFLIEFTPESLAEAAVKLLTDDALFAEFRENAARMAKGTDWNDILRKAFSEI